MKMNAICEKCISSFVEKKATFLVEFDVTEAQVYSLTCKMGHTFSVVLQAMKFELLYEIACDAYIDGHSQSSVSVFSASLERFFEFIIQTYAMHQKIKKDIFVRTWKQMSRQSERQLGAFLIYHLALTGENYELNKKMAEFRNKVIHKGYIPKKHEVEVYGEFVLSEIYSICLKLKGLNFWPSVMEAYRLNIDSAIARTPNNENPTSAGQSNVINLTMPDQLFGHKTFQQAIQETCNRRLRFREMANTIKGLSLGNPK